MTYTPKKLIEVALPLEKINEASAREKSIRHGHPSTLHLWWARRPLAAARAVIFSQMVDDPSEHVPELLADPKKRQAAEKELREQELAWRLRTADFEKAQAGCVVTLSPGVRPTLEDVVAEQERQRLFRLIEKLVLWKNTTNEEVLQQAQGEIWKSWRFTCARNQDHPRAKDLFNPDKLPAFHDPFAGGGSLPLEAQRLGLEAYASDLNPVAVLINKAMIEIPPKFAGRPPVNPESRRNKRLLQKTWSGAEGLAEDVRYYGKWMRDEAEKRIGHLYQKVEVTAEMATDRLDLKPYVGKKLAVIAWLWARTVKSPNPAFATVDVPLASTFMLSTKPGKEAYVEPVIENGGYRFTVNAGRPKDAEAAKNGTKLSRANFACVMSGTAISGDYIKAEGKSGRIGARLMAIVAEGDHGRVYLTPSSEHEATARKAKPTWRPEGDIATRMTGGNCTPYGLTSWGDLFTPRQLVALTTFSDLVQEARELAQRDALAAGLPEDKSLSVGGRGATAYGGAVGVFLGIAISRISSYWSNITTHDTSREKITSVFARQAIPMVWDFMEGNPFSETSGNFLNSIEGGSKSLDQLLPRAGGIASQFDAAKQEISVGKLVSTDPPYYDNIGYADLSDFFYVWLRLSLKSVFPDLFATLAVPKAEELVATPYRHGSKEKAETFFLSGMTNAMHRLADQAHPAFPVTIYYAFKQSETESAGGIASTGWETFLAAVIQAGFAISGTWPMRTEMPGRALERSGTNALASSIILVCRRSAADAGTATRGQFAAALKAELPVALRHLQRGNIAPVDLAQAAIGPGMAVFTRYSKVVDAEGKPLPVRDALALINHTLDEVLAEQEGDFDADTRWAVTWFDGSGFAEGDFGVAETLSKAKNTSVNGMVEAGIVVSKGGKVRLLRPAELPADWDPTTARRVTAWETVHQMVRALGKGEGEAAALVAKLGAKADSARELAYRLYTLCERKKRAQEAQDYNALVLSWPGIMEIMRRAQESARPQPRQGQLV
jgi:putative DNA methylase